MGSAAVYEMNRQRGPVSLEITAADAWPADASDRAGMTERLMEAYGDAVLQLAYFYLRDHGLAEDVVQDVFTRVYLHLGRFRGDSSPRTWIYRIAVNACHDRLRSPVWRRVSVVGTAVMDRLLPLPPDVSEAALAAVDAEVLLRAVMRLPLQFREVVLLYYYEEMDTPQVAAALGLSTGTVRSRLHRARARLRSALVKGGVLDD